jgi:hypothetical protein
MPMLGRRLLFAMLFLTMETASGNLCLTINNPDKSRHLWKVMHPLKHALSGHGCLRETNNLHQKVYYESVVDQF